MPNRFTKNIASYLQADRIAPFLTMTVSDADCARSADAWGKLSPCDQRAVQTFWAKCETPRAPDRFYRDDATVAEILGL